MPSIPFNSLTPIHAQLEDEILQAVVEVYRVGQFIGGPQLAAFEEEYARYCGVRFCVGVANGLDALYVSLKLLGIGEGDEVIVPAHTYIATWLAVSRTGATLVPVDVDPGTMLINVKEAESIITKKTKAIIPVHLYGQPCHIDDLTVFADRFTLKIIEDNAQAHGAAWRNKKTGAFGHCNATSFYPTKNLGALGDGGAITTHDPEVYQQALVLRNYGSAKRFINPVQGINSRLDELQAAVLRVKLKYVDFWNAERRTLAQAYLSRLEGVGDLILPKTQKEAMPVYHLFTVRTERRNELQSFLEQMGIETMIHYPVPPHLQEAYSELGLHKGKFPASEKIAATILSLPLWIGMGEEKVEQVCKAVQTFYSS